MARSSKDRLPPPSGSTASRRSIGDGGSSSSSSRSGGSGVERGRRSSLELSGDPLHPSIFPLPKSKWVPNDVTSVCMACGSGFSKRIFLGSGKHHCRKCGRVVCGECIKNSIYSHKVCDPCFVAFSAYAKVKDTDFSGLNPTHGATYAAMYVAVKASHMDSERKSTIVGKCAPSQLKPTTSKSSTTGSGIDEILYRDDDEDDDDDDTDSETESESEYESSDNEASRSSKENMDDEKMAMSMAMAKKKSTITVIRRELPKMTMKMDLTSVSVSKMRDNEKKEDETLVEEADDLILYKKEEEKEDSVEKPESESEYESASDGDEDEDDSEMIERAVVTLIEDDGDANANELNNHSLGNDSLMITTIATPAAGSRAGRARVLDREHSDGGSIDLYDEDDDVDDALAAVAKSSSLIVRTQLGTLEEQLKQSTGDLLLYLDDDDDDDAAADDADKDSSASGSDAASDAKLADDEDYSAV